MKGVKKTLKTRFILNSAGLERKPAAQKWEFMQIFEYPYISFINARTFI